MTLPVVLQEFFLTVKDLLSKQPLGAASYLKFSHRDKELLSRSVHPILLCASQMYTCTCVYLQTECHPSFCPLCSLWYVLAWVVAPHSVFLPTNRLNFSPSFSLPLPLPSRFCEYPSGNVYHEGVGKCQQYLPH